MKVIMMNERDEFIALLMEHPEAADEVRRILCGKEHSDSGACA